MIDNSIWGTFIGYLKTNNITQEEYNQLLLWAKKRCNKYGAYYDDDTFYGDVINELLIYLKSNVDIDRHEKYIGAYISKCFIGIYEKVFLQTFIPVDIGLQLYSYVTNKDMDDSGFKDSTKQLIEGVKNIISLDTYMGDGIQATNNDIDNNDFYIATILNHLQDSDKKIFTLHFIEGKSIKEIATIYKISYEGMRKKINIIRNKVRNSGLLF